MSRYTTDEDWYRAWHIQFRATQYPAAYVAVLDGLADSDNEGLGTSDDVGDGGVG